MRWKKMRFRYEQIRRVCAGHWERLNLLYKKAEDLEDRSKIQGQCSIPHELIRKSHLGEIGAPEFEMGKKELEQAF